MKWSFTKAAVWAASALVLMGAASDTQNCQKLWRDVGGSVRKSITSNSPHFWDWSKKNAADHLEGYLAPRGLVMGDTHPRNVFDYRAGGKAKLAVADVDDGGQGPLILDLARYLVYLKASKSELKIKELFHAYALGLKGKSTEIPYLLELAQAESKADILAQHARYLEKNTVGGKFNAERLELKTGSAMGAARKAESAVVAEEILKRTGEKKIWDVGYTSMDSGSSAGMDRYWVLVGNEKEPKYVMEAKELSTPALSFYREQKPNGERVDALVKAYSEKGLDEKLFGVAKTKEKEYWVRPRKFQALDLNDKEISDENAEDFSLYIANWMGQQQGKQPGGKTLSRLIEKDEDQAKDAVRDFVRAYLAEVK